LSRCKYKVGGEEVQVQRADLVQRCRDAEMQRCRGAEVQRCRGGAEVQVLRCRGADMEILSEMLRRCRGARCRCAGTAGGGAIVQRCRCAEMQRHGDAEVQIVDIEVLLRCRGADAGELQMCRDAEVQSC